MCIGEAGTPVVILRGRFTSHQVSAEEQDTCSHCSKILWTSSLLVLRKFSLAREHPSLSVKVFLKSPFLLHIKKTQHNLLIDLILERKLRKSSCSFLHYPNLPLRQESPEINVHVKSRKEGNN